MMREEEGAEKWCRYSRGRGVREEAGRECKR